MNLPVCTKKYIIIKKKKKKKKKENEKISLRTIDRIWSR